MTPHASPPSQSPALRIQNERLRWAFDPSSIAQVISKDVYSLQTRSDRSNSSVAMSPSYAAKPYNGKPRPAQLSPRADGTLDSDSTCYYCKDTGHRKNNCIQLNCKLAHELQMMKGIVSHQQNNTSDTQPN